MMLTEEKRIRVMEALSLPLSLLLTTPTLAQNDRWPLVCGSTRGYNVRVAKKSVHKAFFPHRITIESISEAIWMKDLGS